MYRLLVAIARHAIGYGLVFPAILLAIAVQVLIAGPVFGSRHRIQRLIFRTCGWLFGVRYEVNPDSAPLATEGATLFMANHLSRLDFAGLYLFPPSAILMNAMYFRMPVLGPVIKAFAGSVGMVGTEQTQESKPRDLESLAGAVSAGLKIFVFPEGIQTDGRRVLRYSQGTAEMLYDAALLARHPALRNVRLQPVVLRVKTVEGENVLDTPQKWGGYAMTRGRSSLIVGMARASMTLGITIDVLVCPPLDPAQFATAADLVNAAHKTAVSIIAPGQTRTLTRKEWRARLDARDFSV